MTDTQRKPRLTIIDDDPMVCSALRRLLSAVFDVETHSSADAFLEVVRVTGEPDAIVCDRNLDGTSGEDLVRWLATRRPRMVARTVMMTGSSPDEIAPDVAASLRGRIVTKPCDVRALRELLLSLANATSEA